jgi:hypothetical protein
MSLAKARVGRQIVQRHCVKRRARDGPRANGRSSPIRGRSSRSTALAVQSAAADLTSDIDVASQPSCGGQQTGTGGQAASSLTADIRLTK